MHVGELFELAEIGVGDHVADLGCNEGYLSFHLSDQVGLQGKVYAVDVSASRLEVLRAHIKERNTTNIVPVHSDEDDPKLRDRNLDAVMVVDTYHEMKEYKTILRHLKKALKPNGRLLILEKLKGYMKGEDRTAQSNAHTLALKFVKKELEEAGFQVVVEISEFGMWNHEADKQMWVLVAKPIVTDH
tara:strand:+ start:2106 stop:2666 length:561 start_codon:yes stop_codon:yes gene_type:complete